MVQEKSFGDVFAVHVCLHVLSRVRPSSSSYLNSHLFFFNLSFEIYALILLVEQIHIH